MRSTGRENVHSQKRNRECVQSYCRSGKEQSIVDTINTETPIQRNHSSPGLNIIFDGMHLTLTVAWPAFAASISLLLFTFTSFLLDCQIIYVSNYFMKSLKKEKNMKKNMTKLEYSYKKKIIGFIQIISYHNISSRI